MHDGEFKGQALSTLLISPSAYKESSSSFPAALANLEKLSVPDKRTRACLLQEQVEGVNKLLSILNHKGPL